MPKAGPPGAAELERLLAFAAALVERAGREAVGQPRLDDPEPTRQRKMQDGAAGGFEQHRRAPPRERGDRLVHAPAAHAHVVVLRAECDLDEVHGLERPAGEQAERASRRHGKRGGGGEPGADRYRGGHREQGACGRSAPRPELANDAHEVVGPVAPERGVGVRLVHSAIHGGHQAPAVRRPGGDGGAALERHRQDRPAVVIGVLSRADSRARERWPRPWDGWQSSW